MRAIVLSTEKMKTDEINAHLRSSLINYKINTQKVDYRGYSEKKSEILFDLSDRIIFLDPPLIARYCRILIRYIKQKLGIEKCHYKASIHMLKMMFRWTMNLNKTGLPLKHD
jgi:ABC-type microcin C transport system permease subunit YejB